MKQLSIGQVVQVTDTNNRYLHGFMPDEIVEITDLRGVDGIVALVCSSNEREYTGILMGTEVGDL